MMGHKSGCPSHGIDHLQGELCDILEHRNQPKTLLYELLRWFRCVLTHFERFWIFSISVHPCTLPQNLQIIIKIWGDFDEISKFQRHFGNFTSIQRGKRKRWYGGMQESRILKSVKMCSNDPKL